MVPMSFSKPSDLKILFLGTPLLAATVLKALIEGGFSLSGVISQEDKPQGRKGVLEATPTKKVALECGIPVYQPHRIRKEKDFLSSLSYDVIVCVAYGQILPDDILSSAPCGAYNLHGSLLPKYRGAAPMQRAIMDGERETGVCLMRMVKEMDAGEVYSRLSFPIEEEDNYTSLSIKMGQAAAALIVRDLLPLVNGKLRGLPQEEKEVSFAAKILPEEEHLPLTLSAIRTRDYIRALSEKPGAFVYLDNKKIKIYDAKIAPISPNGVVGSLTADKKHLYLHLSDGVLSLLRIQEEGKKAMDAASFLNGHHILPDMLVH